MITFVVGSVEFKSRALAIPGRKMDWTALLSIDATDDYMVSKMTQLLKKKNIPVEETHFLPLHMQGEEITGAVLVCEWEVVVTKEPTEVTRPKNQCEDLEANVQLAEEEAERVGERKSRSW